ncbi:MAG: TolC family protein, partial [Planctomycetota bacterium]
LEDYVKHAALHNPGLRAKFEAWQAALERVPQVTALPEPMFSYAYYIEEVETRVGPQRHRVMVKQMFPWFGTLRLRGEVAEAEAEAAYERLEAARLALDFRVKDAWYELYYLARAVDVTRETVELLEYVESVARSLYRVKKAEYADVIRVQVELDKTRDRLRTLEDRRRPATARLNAALDRAPDAPVPWPEAVSRETLADEAQVLDWMAEANPDLRAIAAQVDRHRVAVDLARKDYYPDLGVGLTWVQTDSAIMSTPDSSKDPLIAELSLTLPLWRGKYAAAEREARARLRGARRSLAERRNALTAAIEMALYGLRDANRRVALYTTTLLPRAEQSLKATQTAYTAAKASLTDLIDAERVLLDFRLARERAVADHAQRLAELEKLVGRRLPRRPAEKGEAQAPPEPTADPGDGQNRERKEK